VSTAAAITATGFSVAVYKATRGTSTAKAIDAYTYFAPGSNVTRYQVEHSTGYLFEKVDQHLKRKLATGASTSLAFDVGKADILSLEMFEQRRKCRR
jgi:hypothetical protein